MGSARPTWGAGAPFSLAWDAPVECPDSDYVKGQVDLLLEDGAEGVPRVEAKARVARAEDGKWRVQLLTEREGNAGERTLDADSCRALADATALVLALTIDPAHVATNGPRAVGPNALPGVPPAAPPPSAPVPPPASATSPVRAAPPPKALPAAESPAERRPERVHGALFAAVGLDVGSLPNLGYGFALGGSLLAGPLRADLYAEAWPYRTETDAAGAGGKVDLFEGAARGCYLPLLRSRIDLGPCVSVELGAMHGAGIAGGSVNQVFTQTGLWAAFGIGARATVRIVGPLRLALDLESVFPFRLPDFTLAGATFHQPGAVSGRVHFGPELRF
jgi:hypothetical protein